MLSVGGYQDRIHGQSVRGNGEVEVFQQLPGPFQKSLDATEVLTHFIGPVGSEDLG